MWLKGGRRFQIATWGRDCGSKPVTRPCRRKASVPWEAISVICHWQSGLAWLLPSNHSLDVVRGVILGIGTCCVLLSLKYSFVAPEWFICAQSCVSKRVHTKCVHVSTICRMHINGNTKCSCLKSKVAGGLQRQADAHTL